MVLYKYRILLLLLCKGPFTIVNSYLFVQGVLKGVGGQGPHTIFFNVRHMRNVTTVASCSATR